MPRLRCAGECPGISREPSQELPGHLPRIINFWPPGSYKAFSHTTIHFSNILIPANIYNIFIHFKVLMYVWNVHLRTQLGTKDDDLSLRNVPGRNHFPDVFFDSSWRFTLCYMRLNGF